MVLSLSLGYLWLNLLKKGSYEKKIETNNQKEKKEYTERPQIIQQVLNKQITETITEIYFLFVWPFFLDNNAINSPSSYFPINYL